MKLLSITLTSTWSETRCGHCPDYEIHTLGGWRGRLFDGIRRRASWQWHKRTLRHKANKWVADGFDRAT